MGFCVFQLSACIHQKYFILEEGETHEVNPNQNRQRSWNFSSHTAFFPNLVFIHHQIFIVCSAVSNNANNAPLHQCNSLSANNEKSNLSRRKSISILNIAPARYWVWLKSLDIIKFIDGNALLSFCMMNILL